MEQDREAMLNKKQSEKMCSLCGNGAGEMCSPADTDTCRSRVLSTTKKYVEIHNFRHFSSILSL